MVHIDPILSTGLPGLDRILRGLMPGDNLVWQVRAIQDYLPFVEAACANAERRRQAIVYFRFAKHDPLLEQRAGVTIHQLRPETGFEGYIRQVHEVIDESRQKALYVFDCLSELVVDWNSDRMLGNFFMLTCPYLYDVGAIAYFALLRDHHSFHATRPIGDTAQILIDVYRHEGRIYVHPLKVQHRNSPTMYMPHEWVGDGFVPVTQSITTTNILRGTPWNRLDIASYHLGIWSSTFARAESICAELDAGEPGPPDLEEFSERLRRMMISQDERILAVARRYLDLRHIVEVRRRMIGTGLIGGKSVGLLLARAILEKDSARWADMLEPHDSFYIGSDVFCTYLVQNGCWWAKQMQQDPNAFLEGAMRARQQMLTGTFPDYLLKQFAAMLDYFGQSPIIVRSSSLLEDAFGNAFAGKYESEFCANQGSRDKRMEDFLSAVRTVYASIMSEDALQYRASRGLLEHDEQMALLVQRVSGAAYGHRFFPQAAGVALSLNPYVWSEYIDPAAGVARIVFGLGTRAVERTPDDYTRIVALNAPERRPEADADEVREHAQRKVDYLDLEANQEVTSGFADVARACEGLPLELFASRDTKLERRAAERKTKDVWAWVLTFDKLLKETPFVADMRAILGALQDVYRYPVEIEYTLNFFEADRYTINVVQCRPLQVKGRGVIAEPPSDIPAQDLVLATRGPVIGHSLVAHIDRIVYVVPSAYARLATYDCYAVARTIGRLMHVEDARERTTLILGPGRWGTTTPSLGVPVNFSEINTANVVCEIATMRDNLVPDVSLGTHFFNELVEMDVLYCALFPGKDGSVLNEDFFQKRPSRLTDLLPEGKDWEHVIRVIDAADLKPLALVLNADAGKQRVVCYLERK
ncbi:MAG: pyruvate, phosphate dikinase [Kiritimatiellae bacterium]|nr:pyruvate, phosphate dikinase [Kiritimatiellia bacterium]